jgi:methylated-DNA-protein-cysteine methyltransferase-like protein
MPSNWYEQVYKVVSAVPHGKVATYGQVAAWLGKPRGARAVGWALRALPPETTTPWWRIVSASGFLSIRGNSVATKTLQQQLLEAEGVEFYDDFRLTLKTYGLTEAPR